MFRSEFGPRATRWTARAQTAVSELRAEVSVKYFVFFFVFCVFCVKETLTELNICETDTAFYREVQLWRF